MGLTEFLAKNKREQKLIDIVVSDEILDENGEPAVWKIKTISEGEDKDLRNACIKSVKNRQGQVVSQEFNNGEYLERLVAKCVVEPDLNNAELQDVYGVKSDYALLGKILAPGEFARLLNKVQDLNNYSPMNDKIEEAKN